MPSSKAILADITRLGLNPAKEYTQIDGSGNLCDKTEEVAKESKPKEHKNALKQLHIEEKADVKVTEQKPEPEHKIAVEKKLEITTAEVIDTTQKADDETEKTEIQEDKPKKSKKKF